MGANLEITDNGIISPDTEEIKTEIQGIFTDAFGTDLSLDDATPQGVLIDDLAQLKQASNSVLLYLANQFNPEVASGIFQDALANLYFIQRREATRSIVTCRCIGVNGTVLNGLPDTNNPTRIPAKAQSTNGDIFDCITGGIIGTPVDDGQGGITYTTDGYIDLQFQSEETGPIPCSANTVNAIYQVVPGWDTVNNSASGVPGKEQESRQEFEKRRVESLALNATGSLSAVQAAIANLDGITHYKVWENVTSSPVTVNGVQLDPHSIYVCLSGGNANDIAEAIYKNKSAGCATTKRNTYYKECTYTDPLTGVSYTYYYENPEDADVYVKITVQNEIPDSIKLDLATAVWNNFNNGDSTNNAVSIGDSVYAGRFFLPISGINAGVIQIQVSKSSSSGFVNYLDFDLNELPTLGDKPVSGDLGNVIIEVAS